MTLAAELCDITTPLLNDYIPHEPTDRQCAGLILPHKEVLYGGAAGGGKSDWLLMGGLQHVEDPGYAALILRREYTQLTKAEGLIPRSHEWLGRTKAIWNGGKATWTFPSGATLEFGHLQHENDKYNYQGAAYQYIGFDELTQFTETQYRYLFSRLRRLVGSSVPQRMRSASNPGGVGHDWVKQRMLLDHNPDRCFLPAKLSDNPHLDQEEYVKSLEELDETTLRQLLNGDWDARPPGAVFKREWFTVIPREEAPLKGRRVRYWDLAATVPKPGTDPDWTVGTLMLRPPKDDPFECYVIDVHRTRVGPGSVEPLLVATAKADGPKTTTYIEQEPGSGGKIAGAHLVKKLAPYPAYADRVTGSKGARAGGFAACAKRGGVALVEGPWLSDWFSELESFGPDCSHDDQVDSASGGYNKLYKNKEFSSFFALNQGAAA